MFNIGLNYLNNYLQYSIKYLEDISEIKAHTIRIWEQRYNLLTPHRTATNIRFYDDEQLRKLLNITSLLNAGYKLSEIAGMSDAMMYAAILMHYDSKGGGLQHYYINELMLAGLAFDRAAFESQFSSCVLKLGFMATVEQVLYPVLKRVGVWWQSAEMNPSQEHFISGLARQKLCSAADGLPVPTGSKKKCLLFLPENEYHEIGLLYFNFLLLKAGIPTIYLGANVPFISLQHAVKETNPTHLVFFRVKKIPVSQANRYQVDLHKHFPDKQAILCGPAMITSKIKLKEAQVLLEDPRAAKEYFRINKAG